MNKKSILATVVVILSLVIIFLLVAKNIFNKNVSLVNPMGGPTIQSPSPLPTDAPPQAPKTFKFDRSTDLKKELESINPEVLDVDFTEENNP